MLAGDASIAISTCTGSPASSGSGDIKGNADQYFDIDKRENPVASEDEQPSERQKCGTLLIE